MPRTKLLEILFVVAAGLGLLFVGWAVFTGNTSAPPPASVLPTAAPTPTPTIPPPPTPTPQPITLTVLHTNDTWGYVRPCG